MCKQIIIDKATIFSVAVFHKSFSTINPISFVPQTHYFKSQLSDPDQTAQKFKTTQQESFERSSFLRLHGFANKKQI